MSATTTDGTDPLTETERQAAALPGGLAWRPPPTVAEAERRAEAAAKTLTEINQKLAAWNRGEVVFASPLERDRAVGALKRAKVDREKCVAWLKANDPRHTQAGALQAAVDKWKREAKASRALLWEVREALVSGALPEALLARLETASDRPWELAAGDAPPPPAAAPPEPAPVPGGEAVPRERRELALTESVLRHPWRGRLPEPRTVREAQEALVRLRAELVSVWADVQAKRDVLDRARAANMVTLDTASGPVDLRTVGGWLNRAYVAFRVKAAQSTALRRWIADRTGEDGAPEVADHLLVEVVELFDRLARGVAVDEGDRRLLRRARAHVAEYRDALYPPPGSEDDAAA
jgi:hypothetical protein